MTRVFHGTSSTFGGAIDLSGGVAMAVGTRRQVDGLTDAGIEAGSKALGNLAIQTANIRAQRPLQQFYDLFSRNVYYVSGRVQASGNMDRILGPKGSMSKLYQQLSDPCLIGQNAVVLSIKGAFCAEGNAADPGKSMKSGGLDVLTGGNKITLYNCAMQDVGISMRAQDFVFMEQFAFTATDLETR